MTNNDFIKRLRMAKEIALSNYKKYYCLLEACRLAGIALEHRAKFGEGTEYAHRSVKWMRECKPTKADIARMFDLSIAALEEK